MSGRLVELGRAPALLRSIEGALTRHPEIAGRTRRYLAGELEEVMGRVKEKEKEPAGNQPTSILLDEELRAKLDRLVEIAEEKFEGQMKRSHVIRWALKKGMAALEEEWAAPKPALVEKPAPKKKGGKR